LALALRPSFLARNDAVDADAGGMNDGFAGPDEREHAANILLAEEK
jgi:hypothetical protein